MKLEFTEDRRVDIQALDAQVSAQAMREWLYARFTGADPLLPMDADSLETPDEVFADLWHRADMASRVRDSLAHASVELLHEAWESEPAEWAESLLHLVATIRPTRCRPFLETIVRHGSFKRDDLKAAGQDQLWLQAAAAYGHSELVNTWRELLGDPDYAVIAYNALARNLGTGALYLPDYYAALPEEDRAVLLREALRELFAHGVDQVHAALGRVRSRLQAIDGLCEAVNEALDSLAQPPLDTPPSPPSYLKDLATIKPATAAAA